MINSTGAIDPDVSLALRSQMPTSHRICYVLGALRAGRANPTTTSTLCLDEAKSCKAPIRLLRQPCPPMSPLDLIRIHSTFERPPPSWSVFRHRQGVPLCLVAMSKLSKQAHTHALAHICRAILGGCLAWQMTTNRCLHLQHSRSLATT